VTNRDRCCEVYVAGASCNVQRTQDFIKRVRADPQLYVAHDWTRDAATVATPDDQLDQDTREVLSVQDLAAVRSCDAFVLLAEPGPVSRGSWVEFGYSLAMLEARALLDHKSLELLAATLEARALLDHKSLELLAATQGAPLIVVAGGERRSIFTSLADFECANDDEAFAAVRGWWLW